MIRAVAIAVLAAASACMLHAASPKPQRTQIRVPFWVDAAEVKPDDLKVKLDGTPAQILSVHSPKEDLMVVVVFDLTGDIAQVNPARDTLIAVMEKAAPGTHVGIMRAQDGLRVLLDPTPDREKLAQTIRGLPISGRPGLLDTVEQAGKVGDAIIRKSAVRLAVLYITDSDIYDYREDYTNPVINSSDQRDLSRRFPEGLVREKISKLENSLAVLEAPLFVVHLRYQRDRLNEAYQTGLLQLAQVTGGSAIFARTLAEIPDAIEKTFARITSLWGMDVQLPDKPLKNVQVQVEGPAGLMYRNRFLLKER